MALNASKIKNDSNFPPIDPMEPGAYPARVVQVLDLGLQKQQAWEGQEKPPKQMIYVTYEMADEFLKDEDGKDIEDKPRWLSEEFALHSLDSDMATSTKRYYAIDSTNKFGGDWTKVVGEPCTVNVVNKKKKKDGTVYNKVGSVSSMRPKDAENLPKLVNPPKIFDMDDPDMEIFGSLPAWLQDKMKGNLDFDGSALEKALSGSTDKVKDEEPEPKKDPEDSNGDDW